MYDLRRTAGSLLVDAGVHLEQGADLLGHADGATTRRHYVRAMRPTISHAQQLEELLNDQGKPQQAKSRTPNRSAYAH